MIPTYQARCGEVVRQICDDYGDPTDAVERRDRFLEEAVELVQALGMSRQEVLQVVQYVFSRPAGEPSQEFGGTAMTLASVAEWSGHDLEAAAEAELERCRQPEVVEKIRRKRSTRHGRGPLPGYSAPVPGVAAHCDSSRDRPDDEGGPGGAADDTASPPWAADVQRDLESSIADVLLEGGALSPRQFARRLMVDVARLAVEPLPAVASPEMRRAGVSLAMRISLSGNYRWDNYMGDLWSVMAEVHYKRICGG